MGLTHDDSDDTGGTTMPVSVTIAGAVWTDPRFKALARILKIPRFDAIGRMAYLWGLCTDQETNVLAELAVATSLDVDIGAAGPLLEACELGEVVTEGIRIRGCEGRTGWLGERRGRQEEYRERMREKGRAGGQASVAARRKLGSAVPVGARNAPRRPPDQATEPTPKPHRSGDRTNAEAPTEAPPKRGPNKRRSAAEAPPNAQGNYLAARPPHPPVASLLPGATGGDPPSAAVAAPEGAQEVLVQPVLGGDGSALRSVRPEVAARQSANEDAVASGAPRRPKASPDRKPPSPDHQRFVDGFDRRFAAARSGARPTWGAKQGRLVRGILKRADLEEALVRADRMFAMAAGGWPTTPDLGMLTSCWDKFAPPVAVNGGHGRPATREEFDHLCRDVPDGALGTWDDRLGKFVVDEAAMAAEAART